MKITSRNINSDSCRLCLLKVNVVGPLCQSHIIPRFMLLLAKDRGKSVIYSGGRSKPVTGQFDWKETMLCRACESRIKEYEDYIYAILFARKNKSLLWESREVAVYKANHDKFVLCFLTIFWRSAESSLPEFNTIVIPDYMRENIRVAIFHKRLPTDWNVLINLKIEKLVGLEGESFNIVLTPYVRRIDPDICFEFVFSFAGFYCVFQLPAAGQADRMRFQIKPRSSILRIRKKIFTQLPDVNRQVLEMLAADKGIKLTEDQIAPV